MPATNRRGKRLRLQEEPLDEFEDDVQPVIAVANRGRRLRFWGVALALVTVALWLAPMVVARTPLMNQILAGALSAVPGSVSTRSASLGWFSPVVLSDVQLRDEDDELLGRAESVEGNVSLWQMLFSTTQPGKFRVVRPEFRITVTSEESNFERWLSSLPEGSSSLNCPAMQIELVDGVLAIEDTTTDRRWQIEEINALVTLAHNWSRPMELKVAAKVPQPGSAGGLEMEMKLERALDKMERASQRGELTLKCEGLPLVVAEPLLRRRWRRLELEGWFNSDAGLMWHADETGLTHLAVQGEVGTDQLRFTGPLLGRDELRLTSLKAPCRAEFDGQELTIERLSINCDVGEARLDGPVRIPLDGVAPEKHWQKLAAETYEVSGNVDLAKLAALLPETIRIREGTTISAGQLSWQMTSRQDQGQTRWQGRIESSNLVGQSEERRWTWQKPMHVTFAAHEAAQGLVVDKLDCQSNFLQAEASGRLDQMTGWATFDLNLLAAELGQFWDLKQVRLAGDGSANLDWKRSQDGGFQADGEFQVRDFELAIPCHRPWKEEHLTVTCSLAGQADEEHLHLVEKASLKLESKPDTLVLELREAVSSLTTSANWPIHITADGDLATWLPRLELVVGDIAAELDGNGHLDATAIASLDRVEIEDANCHCQPLKVSLPTLHIDEPQADLYLKGVFTRKPQEAKLAVLQLESEGLAIDARQVYLWLASDRDWMASGTARYSGELARWQQWTADPKHPALWQWSGHVRGELKLSTNDDPPGVTANWETQIQDLQATCPDHPPWEEPLVELNGDIRYLRNKELLAIDRLRAASQSLNCEAAGQIADLRGERGLSINGQLDYEPQKLLDLLRPYIGDEVQITATREARPFALQGPLAVLASGSQGNQTPKELVDALYRQFAAEATVGWTGAELYGFRVGSGELRGRIADGTLNVNPLNLIVSEGRLTASPRVRLWPEPAEMQLDSGPLLTKVRITPPMCEAGLKYILPVLAGVAQAQGEFSIAMDGCNVPLDQPERGELAGQFTVHSIDIGPGPLVRELATLLERPGVVRLSRESVVPFRMVDGRVYHRDLELVFPEMTIRTHGSVGLDRTLAILAEMPVPPKWIGNNPLGTALKNQTISLPIGGTLSEPRIDPKALAQASAEFLRAGTRNLLMDGLNRGLDRFLKPPKEE